MIYKLLRASEKDARSIAIKELTANGYYPTITDDFIYAEGSVPVLLIAHYDTVLKEPPKKIHKKGSVLTAPNGLGADDRAGMYAILQIVRKHHCHVLFTGGEEHGGAGADAFTRSKIMPKVNFCVELDRRGTNDAVYYEGGNEEFEEYVTSKGWKTAQGTFTDICIVAPYIGVAAVNLSIGYQNEHRKDESLDLDALEKIIKRVPSLFETDKKFEWVDAPRSFYRDYYGDYYGYGYGYGDYPEYDEEYYVIEYTDKSKRRRMDLASGRSEYEALGMFFVDHPDVCYSDITEFSREGY